MENMFEALKTKKEHLRKKVIQAKEFGWIDESRCNEILGKIDSDVLTIGVIGQMKCGKSTFLNSFVFEDDILPSATTPMTAALSVITYGEKEKIVAEFYNGDEWAEMRLQADRDLSEASGNSLLESKIKAAKELVSKSSKLGDQLPELLKKGSQEDTFGNLIDYVGAEGKYVAITKVVTIYYPKDYLKGVEIVDTPGFNDPIVSREERTNEFLKKADVVLMMLYAGRPFDATDRDIIFKNVRQCGIGKVIIGINKYDIPYEKGETEQQIQQYVKDELEKACRECNDTLLVEVLDKVMPIPVSASMALLSEIPMSKINTTEAYSFDWKRFCDIFEVSNQPEMRRVSKIDDLFNAVRNLVEQEKDEILFKKPNNTIMAAGQKVRDDNDRELQETGILLDNLSTPDEELEEKKERLGKAKRRLVKKIDALDDDMDLQFKNMVRNGKRELEDIVDASCNRMETIINNGSKVKPVDSIKPDLEKETQRLITRDFKRAVEDIGKTAERTTKNAVRDFMTDAEEVLMRYMPDIDSEDTVRKISAKIEMEIENADLFSYGAQKESDNQSIWSLLENGATMILGGAIGVTIKEGLKMGYNAITHDKKKQELMNNLMDLRNMDMAPYLNSVFANKQTLIDNIRASFISELVDPLETQINEILQNTQSREEERQNAEKKLEELKLRKADIVKQFEMLS